ncbi:hypothetical protein TVAG_387230 [Trichomonas vaginalis G3]|uniref:Uncharacterized protein n=1 Tax=Trichomonas vaginalis (strain ATCC PRA-98 / G3) TaxID=412133 RepID=A2HBQ0_TRIV3|nr:hypothetical protein TVAG_387230 [Trichomonas vaginalis G3]|eukprot:XP_001286097.1 hypothetical protein [Trichomonas vaginalis G3]
MTKITDTATRQAVQSAYDAVRATVVKSQEKELQQTKTDLVNAFLKTKSQVGHYAADGTYVPAGGTYVPAGGTYILASGTYIPPNPPREAPAPGLPNTFTSSHGHRHRHAPKPAQQPTVQNPAQQPAQQPPPQPTVQNPAQQPPPQPAQQPTVQNPAQQPPPQPTVQNPAQQPPPQPAQQPTVQNPAQQQPQTEQGHKRSREQGNQEFLKMLKEEYGYPDTIDFSDRYKEAIRKFNEGNSDPNLFSFMALHQRGYNLKPGKYKLAKGYDLIAYHPNDMNEFTPRYLMSELNDNLTLFMKRVKNRDGTKEERFVSPDDLERELVENGLGIYEMLPDEVQETPQEEIVQIQPDMDEIVQQQQLEEPEGNEQVPPLETNFTELDEDLEQPKNLDPQQEYEVNMESFQEV